MNSEAIFHESFEPKLIGIKVYMINPARYDTTRPLEGDYYRVFGIPTYLARFRRLGSFGNNNYELIKLVTEELAHARIELEGNVYYGRFHPIATTSEQRIIQIARNEWQNDLLADINFNSDNITNDRN